MSVIAKNWWSLVIRGVVAVTLGIITFVSPGITLGALVLLYAAYAFLDGILAIAGAVRAAESRERWGILLIEGVAGIAAGIITVAWPAITALALVYVIAAWALVTGIFEIVAAVRLRKHISHEWLLFVSGTVSLALGILMATVPMAGALAIALWVGAYAFVFGLLLVALGFKLRRWTREPHGGSNVTAPAY